MAYKKIITRNQHRPMIWKFKIQTLFGMIFFLLIGILSCSSEKNIANVEAETYITQKLTHFLEHAATSAEVHDRFWSERLIYTSSSGSRFGKNHIMAGFETSDNENAETPSVRYHAEDITITFFQKTARLTFTLVAVDTANGHTDSTRFYNSGMLVPKGNTWEVVLWQATRMAE